MAATNGITFDVDLSLEVAKYNKWNKPPNDTSTKEYVQKLDITKQNKGQVLLATETAGNQKPFCGNGIIGTMLRAYNNHHPLVLSPDDIWVSITCTLAGYIDRNAEAMRPLFVNHEGKMELKAYQNASLLTADYGSLVDDLSGQIDNNTKDDIRQWLECDFSTSTKHTKLISKIVLMGAMKNYFEYKMCLCCGLPSVTLKGTKSDWVHLYNRIAKMRSWGHKDLSNWADVLEFVLQNFVDAFDGKIDKDFWNRIASTSGGGSGPSYVHGWMLTFCPFNDAGKYILYPLDEIKESNDYGSLDDGDIPACAVEVPVTIDDNGTEYKTIFYAGVLMTHHDSKTEALRPSLEWALIRVS